MRRAIALRRPSVFCATCGVIFIWRISSTESRAPYPLPPCPITQASSRQDPTFNLIGHPRGPLMKCGWGCGEQLTGRNMRAHFCNMPEAAGKLRPRGTDEGETRKPSVGARRGRGRNAVGVAAPSLPSTTVIRTWVRRIASISGMAFRVDRFWVANSERYANAAEATALKLKVIHLAWKASAINASGGAMKRESGAALRNLNGRNVSERTTSARSPLP
jgi:hypothetical protein